MIREEMKYILVSYRLENGFVRNLKVLEYSNFKERLEYLMSCDKYQALINQGYILDIFGK